MQPLLSVIIPTHNRLDILNETYNALIEAAKNIEIEILILNDGNNITTEDISEKLKINDETIVLQNKKKGAAGARNFGANLAKGDILLFIDDDIIVNENTLLNILSLHNTFDRILSTPIWEYSEPLKEMLNESIFGRYKALYDYMPIRGNVGKEIIGQGNLFYVDALAAFCLSIKRRHYAELNGMDESFPYAGCEDQDFAARAKAMGFDLLLDENNIVKHNELDRVKRENWLKRQFSGVQGFVILCQKFPERKRFALWVENTPIQLQDPLKLKIKKAFKFFLRQELSLALLNLIVKLFEKLKMPDSILFKLFNLQAGLYLNKGFTKSYKKICT